MAKQEREIYRIDLRQSQKMFFVLSDTDEPFLIEWRPCSHAETDEEALIDVNTTLLKSELKLSDSISLNPQSKSVKDRGSRQAESARSRRYKESRKEKQRELLENMFPEDPLYKPYVPDKIFISYSWDSEEHKDRVLKFANHLRRSGIDCELDQYYSELPPDIGWDNWSENQIEEAEFTLVICTKQYMNRYRGKEESGGGKGATWEGAIITQTLYQNYGKNNKFIPIIFSKEEIEYVPNMLKRSSFYVLDSDFERLIRRLTKQPETPKPELGRVPVLAPREF